jgi:hypothetical protein
MKTLMNIYRNNAILALIINCVGFFIWATTMVIVIVMIAVACTHG